MTTTVIALNALTTETTAQLAEILALKNSLEARIAAAVLVSTNAALIPLFNLTTNVVDTQTLLVTYIAKG